MNYSKEDLQQIKLPLSRETFLNLFHGSTPKVKDWPKDLLEQFSAWISKYHVERGLSDWE